jgi:hypothetical protein
VSPLQNYGLSENLNQSLQAAEPVITDGSIPIPAAASTFSFLNYLFGSANLLLNPTRVLKFQSRLCGGELAWPHLAGGAQVSKQPARQ